MKATRSAPRVGRDRSSAEERVQPATPRTPAKSQPKDHTIMFQFIRPALTSLGSVTLTSTGIAAGRAAGFVAVSTAGYLVGRTTLRLAYRGTTAMSGLLKEGVLTMDSRLNGEAVPTEPAAKPRKNNDLDPVELEIARRIKAGILQRVVVEPTAAAAE